MTAELHRLSATELLAAYRVGTTDPVAAVDHCQARIERLDGAIHAVVTPAGERARHRAVEAARRWADGTARPLEGVPVLVKDIIDTAGLRTAAGSAMWDGRVPASDATAVARLEAAGAIVVGKSATPELAFGDEREPGVVNPWAAGRWTGGSSSGSAAALAARLVPLALGTDTGGSIRVPSSYCGVSGLKPTSGRVPRTGTFPVSWTLDHVGPMARHVDDLALALAVLAGPDGIDPYASDRPAPAAAAPDPDVRGMRVGLVSGWLAETCSPAVLAARDDVAMTLATLGAQVVPVELPHAELACTIAWVITVTEFASYHEQRFDRIHEYSPSAAQRLAAGAAMPAIDYLKALRLRERFQHDLEAAFARADVLLLPGTPTAAPDLTTFFDDGDRLWLEKVARTFLPFNVAGSPALVVPSGFDGPVPTAVQFVGRPFDEASCLRAGAAWQRATDHHRRTPAAADEPTEDVR